MTQPTRRTKRRTRMWGGFLNRRLDTQATMIAAFDVAAVFVRRRDARELYEDVRPVLVTWTAPAPKRRGQGGKR